MLEQALAFRWALLEALSAGDATAMEMMELHLESIMHQKKLHKIINIIRAAHCLTKQ